MSEAPQAPPTRAESGAGEERAPGGLAGVIERGAAYGHGPALRYWDGQAWREMSYPELKRAADEVAWGLVSLGLEPGERVAILSETSPEWTIADFGALRAGGIVVPIYQTNSPEECAYVLRHSGAKVIFCEDEGQLAKVEEVRDSCPDLEHVVSFDEAAAGAAGAISLAELRKRGAEAGSGPLQREVEEEAPATIIYTSGTTGPPKGCVLTHANLLSVVRMYGDALELGREPFSVYHFLPLAHGLARDVQMVVLARGGTLIYWRRDSQLILRDLAETKPHYFPSVPRVFEKAHARITAQAEERTPRGLLLRWALATGAEMRKAERAGGAGPLLRLRYALADRLALAKIRQLFGGNLRYALTGAASIALDVLELFEACGIPVLEGYGLSESCAAATLNVPGATRLGTVGRALEGVEVKIADDGEILIKGPNVFRGYYRDEEATREALTDDGWLLSGDLGTLEDGYLRITGRKKELIITAGGKNISPTNIETLLREQPWISQAVVYGDNRPYLVALLTLDPEGVPALAQEVGAPADPAALAKHPKVREILQAKVDEVNRRLARVEQVKRFDVLEQDLSQEHEELTPTLKVKRKVVYERYADRFDALYNR